MPHILIIDDDTELTALLKEVLSLEGFSVAEAHDGEAGLHMLDERTDIILLDVMMPKLNGMETLKRIRSASQYAQTPVLMLTAKGEEIDRVIGLELGADDYLPKPFSDRELLARIRAILRRTQYTPTHQSSEIIESEDLRLYPKRQEAYCNDQLLELTTTEFALLTHFVQHPGETLTKETLSLDVLGKRLAAFDRAIDMHVSNLRKKLPPRSDGRERIKTLRGRGYLMIAEE
ncbi:response regulator [Vibrio gazogenes]|uniref:Two-component system, OmpR family, response regulator CpxR n=1 Tax=Vibrio gazogenes DSM 21264 = NBRC 103151 TaxID=1123492 RepID=A0A1M5D4L1_VIBGA|nr:response regulator [Vibrio gazogenes]USP13956.1 response regulator [Vibrio gazogenes]SHF62023.1 two-component system, OmpR family, response regulator CpxR [Vibrio gazogenes DSM 21264] [Vibrio gazogenes DSM 21264 = NBRC 103151]SJN54974.1 Alkaline phosphatase synthesis transcriptional regulatory protein PhoP [Vibrio gazogenes]